MRVRKGALSHCPRFCIDLIMRVLYYSMIGVFRHLEPEYFLNSILEIKIGWYK